MAYYTRDDMLDGEALLLGDLNLSPEKDTETIVTLWLPQRAGDVTLRYVGEKLGYAHPEAYEVLEEFKGIERRAMNSEAKVKETYTQPAVNRQHVCSLESGIRQLIAASGGYAINQRRFVTIQVRDVGGLDQYNGSRGIESGDSGAFAGDAFGDGVVYDRDRSTLRELHGVDYQQILQIHSKIKGQAHVRVLNSPATLCPIGKPLPDGREATVKSILDRFEQYWLEPPDTVSNTNFKSVWHAFWKKHNKKSS